MIRAALVVFAISLLGPVPAALADGLAGTYLETRTCQVYTGPCFANGESNLAGKEALMAWSIESGGVSGVNLRGLNVVVAVSASDTLGFGGLADARTLKALVLVDERADASQREALVEFARQHAGPAGAAIVRVEAVPISMDLDIARLQGALQAGKAARLTTRAARAGDCICSNETAYYPPLAEVEHFVPGVTLEGEFQGRGLGTRWSTPNSRSAYMGTFAY